MERTVSDPRLWADDAADRPYVCEFCGKQWKYRAAVAMCCDPAAPGEAD